MSNEIRRCPVCGKEYTEFPALSRKDNKTEICSSCGSAEALYEFFMLDDKKMKPMVEDVMRGYKYAESWSDSQDGSYGAAWDAFLREMKEKYMLSYADVKLIIWMNTNG